MPLIARETELDVVIERLRHHRLVTIVGPGGVGKTALAQATADVAGPTFAYGARTVDLTRTDSSDGVRELIAGQLGFADFDSLLNSPGDQPALVVIDNCEHVLDAAANAIDEMLAACRMPTVLATSRSPLDVAEETLVSLAPLPVPAAGGDEADVGAVLMFVERVRDFGGHLRTGDDDAIAEICRRLDGVPLALELAAARTRTNTIDEILAEIDARPAGLARPRFRGRSAHRSVADMVEWSLLLLDGTTRACFDTLGAIAGPFTSAMAHAVMASASQADADAVLHELVDASLVVADTSGARTWYRLLHPVRAVARARLSADAGLESAVDRAVDYVVALSIEIVVGSSIGWSEQLTILLGMYDNLIASLRWANEHDDRPDRALTLLAVLWGVVHQSHTAEVGNVGEAVIANWPDRDAPFWADAAATVATCRNLLGNHAEAIELASTTLGHTGASPFAPASLRRVIAQAHRASGNSEDARTWFAAGADAAIEYDVHGFAMELRVDEALLLAELGDHGTALRLVDDVIAEATRRDAPINVAWARCGRGAILHTRGDDSALAELELAVEYTRSIRYPAGISFALRMIAGCRIEHGDLPGASATLLELLDELLQRGGLNDLRMVLDHAACVLEATGDDGWLDAAATAQALPVTTVGAAVTSDIFDRAAGRGTVLATRDAYRLCRDRLRIISEHGATPSATTSTSPAATSDREHSLVSEGDVWRWSSDGTTFAIKASKGMTDLSRLLAEPGREISALDLMGSTKVGTIVTETLDGRARREIESRIRELQSTIDEAENDHDLARAELAAVEMDRLIDELTAAVGLGGRARATGSDPERARSAVTQRIRSTIARIERLHPKLGAHLASAVETGTFCAYRPAEPLDWHVVR